MPQLVLGTRRCLVRSLLMLFVSILMGACSSEPPIDVPPYAAAREAGVNLTLSRDLLNREDHQAIAALREFVLGKDREYVQLIQDWLAILDILARAERPLVCVSVPEGEWIHIEPDDPCVDQGEGLVRDLSTAASFGEVFDDRELSVLPSMPQIVAGLRRLREEVTPDDPRTAAFEVWQYMDARYLLAAAMVGRAQALYECYLSFPLWEWPYGSAQHRIALSACQTWTGMSALHYLEKRLPVGGELDHPLEPFGMPRAN